MGAPEKRSLERAQRAEERGFGFIAGDNGGKAF
jgi:cold shock CspA family protein